MGTIDISEALAIQAGFTPDRIQQMHEAALQTLREVGIAVENDVALEALRRAGVRVEGQRAFFEPAFVEEQLAAIRKGWETPRPTRRQAPVEPSRITVTVGDMCQYYHSPYTDEIQLMTTANVVEATKAVQTMHDVGLGSYVPGVPRDVPYQLQAITEFRIGCEFAPGSPTLDTLHPPEALPYLFEMADAMGLPMRGTNIFPVSPLRLSGYEFDVAVRLAARWEYFSVTTYPAMGASAPVRPRSAWVLSIAEALGGALTLHIVSGGKPVWINVGMFPFDLRSFTIVGGMPEIVWMYWASSRVNRFYRPDAGYSMILSTQAKRPGLQASLEKAMAATFGALTGCQDLHYVGVMSFDDIFSPEQMVADCELRDAVEHLRQGIPEGEPERWVEEIREGVIGRGYVHVDTTLDHYREVYWFPKFLDRTSWHTFSTQGGKTARQRVREEIQNRLANYAYKPPAQIEEVRRIFAEAWRKLGGDPQAECLRVLSND